MSKKLKLSKKYGINASCAVCFFCGKEVGLAMLGHLKGDVKAPRRIVANYTPCNECKEKHKQGRVIIEATKVKNGLPPIHEGVWPTGRWCLVNKSVGEALFKDGKDTPILLEDNLYQQLIERTKTNELSNS